MSGELLLSRVPRIVQTLDIEVCPLFNKDSTNVGPEDWVIIADTVFENRDSFDGIVVLHGTDTMAYSASAVSFMTLGLKIPVIFTGAQYPAEQPGGDAARNLQNALLAACCNELKGVFLVFDGVIYNGCCISKVSTKGLRAFEDGGTGPVGYVRHGEIVIKALPHRDQGEGMQWHREISRRVLFLKVVPGMDERILGFAGNGQYSALILEGFGLGGIPSDGGKILRRIAQLHRGGIVVVVTTQCIRGTCDMTVYRVGQEALRQGALCSRVITKEALLTKLMWVLSKTQDPTEIEHLLIHDFCGELGKKSRKIKVDKKKGVSYHSSIS